MYNYIYIYYIWIASIIWGCLFCESPVSRWTWGYLPRIHPAPRRGLRGNTCLQPLGLHRSSQTREFETEREILFLCWYSTNCSPLLDPSGFVLQTCSGTFPFSRLMRKVDIEEKSRDSWRRLQFLGIRCYSFACWSWLSRNMHKLEMLRRRYKMADFVFVFVQVWEILWGSPQIASQLNVFFGMPEQSLSDVWGEKQRTKSENRTSCSFSAVD